MLREPKATYPAKTEMTAADARKGAGGLVEDLLSARHELLATRHPAYYRVVGVLLSLLSGPRANPALLAKFRSIWKTRSFPTFYERPLLILAALRADALQVGATHPLYAAVAAATPDPDVVTTEAVATAFGPDRLGIWSTMTNRRMQTNDTGRAVAWLWPAFLAGCDGPKRPLALADIGASAGLNLLGDQLPHIWTDRATGKPIPCATKPTTIARVGFDSRPLDAANEDDVLWMRSCIWAGDTARLARFEASVAAMRAPSGRALRPTLERLSASLVPERLRTLCDRTTGSTLLLACQTLLSGYLEEKERESYRAGMLKLVAGQRVGSVLWIELEVDDARRRLPAVFMAHFRAGDGVKSLRIGRSSQHPTEIEVDVAGVAELCRSLAP